MRISDWSSDVCSSDLSPSTLLINQDATLYGALLEKGVSTTYDLKENRPAYVVVADGKATVNGQTVETRAGAALVGEGKLEIIAPEGAEFLMFDVPRPT